MKKNSILYKDICKITLASLILASLILIMTNHSSSIFGSTSYSKDYVPPTVANVSRYPSQDIMPWDTVNISAFITDSESGIKEACIYYTIGDSPIGKVFKKIEMELVDGDIYNGLYVGSIPPQPVGTRVWYYLNISDNAGNYFIYPNIGTYDGYIIKKPYSSISIGHIRIIDINTKNMTIAMEVSFVMILPSSNGYQCINVEVYQIFEDGTRDIFFVSVPLSSGRFEYKTEKILHLFLEGEPEKYPLDKYVINLNFTFYWSSVDRLKAGPVHLSPPLVEEWTKRYPEPKVYNESIPVILYNIAIERSPKGKAAIEVILNSILILSAMTLVISPSELEKRIEIFIGIFIFNLTFLFNIKSYLPFTTSFTFAEITVFLTNAFVILLIIASILAYAAEKHIGKKISYWGDGIEITFVFIFIIQYLLPSGIPYLNTLVIFILIAYALRYLVIGIFLTKFDEIANLIGTHIVKHLKRIKDLFSKFKR